MESELKTGLIEKIATKQAKIAVVGLGYVGLPTAAMFANLGFKVNGLDTNSKIVHGINKNKLESTELGLEKQVREARDKGLLEATCVAFEALSGVDVVIACVQTPVDKQGNANLSFLEKACGEIGRHLRRQELVIIQSTVPPGSVCKVVLPIFEEQSGLKCGVDFWLTYCPERMAPGNGLNDLAANARLIGAYDCQSAVLGVELFKLVTKGELLVTNIASAEISKLAENTFRFVNIAFANELALICGQLGVDVQEVIRLANTHPRVNIHQPGCGAGGPCLSKDTNLLLKSVEFTGFKADVIPAALRLNTAMARYIVDFAEQGLDKFGKSLEHAKVAVFGTAYKGDVNDSRDSPSEGIIRELDRRHAKVIVYDPICSESFGQYKAKDLVEAVKGVDCIIIATDHKHFSELNLAEIKALMNKNPLIVDGKRIINPAVAKNTGFDYIAVSCVLKDTEIMELKARMG